MNWFLIDFLISISLRTPIHSTHNSGIGRLGGTRELSKSNLATPLTTPKLSHLKKEKVEIKTDFPSKRSLDPMFSVIDNQKQKKCAIIRDTC